MVSNMFRRFIVKTSLLPLPSLLFLTAKSGSKSHFTVVVVLVVVVLVVTFRQ